LGADASSIGCKISCPAAPAGNRRPAFCGFARSCAVPASAGPRRAVRFYTRLCDRHVWGGIEPDRHRSSGPSRFGRGQLTWMAYCNATLTALAERIPALLVLSRMVGRFGRPICRRFKNRALVRGWRGSGVNVPRGFEVGLIASDRLHSWRPGRRGFGWAIPVENAAIAQLFNYSFSALSSSTGGRAGRSPVTRKSDPKGQQAGEFSSFDSPVVRGRPIGGSRKQINFGLIGHLREPCGASGCCMRRGGEEA